MPDREEFIGNGPKYKKGMVDFKGIQGLLENFQADGIDYLYDVEPQSQNLFYAGWFQENGAVPAEANKLVRPFHNAQYRIRKISIPYPKLDIEMHPILRTPLIKGAIYDQDITIEWYEDIYKSVSQYHLDWISRWYSRRFDVLRCGVSGKFKQLAVIAFHYVNNVEGPSIIESPVIQPVLVYHLGGLVPKDLPNNVFDYGTDANDQSLVINYKCGVINWFYNEEIGYGYGQDPNVESFDGTKRIWDPKNVMMATPDVSQMLEKHRVARSATASIVE